VVTDVSPPSSRPETLAPPQKPPVEQPRLAAPDEVRPLREAIQMVSSVVVGQQAMVERLMVGLLARGHVLLEGVPGVAKTLAARSFATVVGGSFARLQFTPDLVPSDIVGTRIYRPSSEAFDIELGPVFVNIVLADEINRAPAKVQAAMLELMAEHQVSLGGQSFTLPEPFMVIATQNPLPRAHEETEILRRMSVDPPSAAPVFGAAEVVALQQAADRIYVHPLVADYVVRIVMATRAPVDYGIPDFAGVIDAGASPRATLGLVAAARALALLHGRNHVLPNDIQSLAGDVIAHRLVLGFDAVADGISPRSVVERVLRTVPAPLPQR
jgi:MoxR-like ATPase